MTAKNRKPLASEDGVLENYPAVVTPWGKLIGLREVHKRDLRHNASVAALFMQVLRIVEPDYLTRCDLLCTVNRPNYYETYKIDGFRACERDAKCIHPFIRGGYANAFAADHGDEALHMCGRVNDYSTYRTEKELDTCPWEIVGSEYCRCTTNYTQDMNDAWTEVTPGSVPLEYNMVEARGCGDRHCRLIGESREKWPLPKKEHPSDCFGPIATGDYIKFTNEEDCYHEPQEYREETGHRYLSPTDARFNANELFEAMAALPEGTNSVIRVLDAISEEKGADFIENVIKCVFEGGGKAAFMEFPCIKGMRDYLGVPGDVNDGRVLGGLIEVTLQSMLMEYEIVSFDEDGAVYDISRPNLQRKLRWLDKAYVSMWHGMVKTLVGSEWSVWEDEETLDNVNTMRLHVRRRINKFQ